MIWNLWEDDQGESIKKTTFEPKLQTNDVGLSLGQKKSIRDLSEFRIRTML
ncbi:unnamed protein product [Brassica rapa]|uniref:Uncharacterized protein n=2 Tax=Brassica TaxID=3705 RepID=A0A8D9H7S9_BRACM|nr:unnamed protein product [Brassica napus]CAG7893304.1 unnamed protein product [Brassica rapa]